MHNCNMQLRCNPRPKPPFKHRLVHCTSFALHATLCHHSCHVPCCTHVLAVSQVACSKLALASIASPVQDLTNWEGFRRTKRQKCWRAFPCSDLAASGILLWPASTLQVGLHLIHVVHSPRCIHLDASNRCAYSSICYLVLQLTVLACG